MFTEDFGVETRDVRGFDQIIFRDDSCAARLYIEQGEVEALGIEAKPELIRRIETEVRDRKLTIRFGGSWLERLGDRLTTGLTRPAIVYRLQVRELRSLDLVCAAAVHVPSLRTDRLKIKVSGTGAVVVEFLKAEELEIEQWGAGTIEIAGQVGSQDVRLYGMGWYAASGLRTEHTVIRVSGPAQAQVYASQVLEAIVRGMGMVEYGGDPRVWRRSFGLGSVVRAEQPTLDMQ